MGLVLMSVGSIQGPQRSLPEGMFPSISPTHAFMLCTCEDFSEAGAVKRGFSSQDVLADFCSDAESWKSRRLGRTFQLF